MVNPAPVQPVTCAVSGITYMTKWKKDATDFDMLVVDDGKGSRYVRIPKPLDELMGPPDSVRFVIGEGWGKKRITVRGVDD